MKKDLQNLYVSSVYFWMEFHVLLIRHIFFYKLNSQAVLPIRLRHFDLPLYNTLEQELILSGMNISIEIAVSIVKSRLHLTNKPFPETSHNIPQAINNPESSFT